MPTVKYYGQYGLHVDIHNNYGYINISAFKPFFAGSLVIDKCVTSLVLFRRLWLDDIREILSALPNEMSIADRLELMCSCGTVSVKQRTIYSLWLLNKQHQVFIIQYIRIGCMVYNSARARHKRSGRFFIWQRYNRWTVIKLNKHQLWMCGRKKTRIFYHTTVTNFWTISSPLPRHSFITHVHRLDWMSIVNYLVKVTNVIANCNIIGFNGACSMQLNIWNMIGKTIMTEDLIKLNIT